LAMDTAIQSFTKYVPKDVVRDLLNTGAACDLTMKPMRCTSLFTDIAGFTSICERVPAPILSSLVRKYFERTSAVVMHHGGIIDKYIGDCIMACWGAPFPVDNQELRAALCGKMMHRATTEEPLVSDFAAAGEVLNIRVGVATGDVLAGNMGSRDRMSYTVIGDDVNLASRLEALNKQWGTGVMLAEATALEVEEYLCLRYLVSIAVVGKAQPVRAYEVLGVRPDAPASVAGACSANMAEGKSAASTEVVTAGATTPYIEGGEATNINRLLRRAKRKILACDEDVRWAAQHSSAMKAFSEGRFADTIAAFEKLKDTSVYPVGAYDHLSVQKVISRCEELLREPPSPKEWTGVWIAVEK